MVGLGNIPSYHSVQTFPSLSCAPGKPPCGYFGKGAEIITLLPAENLPIANRY